MQCTPFAAAVLTTAVVRTIVVGYASASDGLPKNRGWETGAAGGGNREESGAPGEG